MKRIIIIFGKIRRNTGIFFIIVSEDLLGQMMISSNIYISLVNSKNAILLAGNAN